jgi:hypothetical protein
MRVSRDLDALVFARHHLAGGTKSLYHVCEALACIGRCTIMNYKSPTQQMAGWFHHRCKPYDFSYTPRVVLYPEVYQPQLPHVEHHVCLALGKNGKIGQVQPHATLAVCKSPAIVSWVRATNRSTPTVIVPPSIDRALFEYDGRPKRDIICYMRRPNKHPETAQALRQRYGDKVVDIAGIPEAEVAQILKEAKVFVWRSGPKEGSPRPPKEALVAGCVVVGLKTDLCDDYFTNFGVRCSTVDEVIEAAGEGLKMPVPTREERSVVRDKNDETLDWISLAERWFN